MRSILCSLLATLATVSASHYVIAEQEFRSSVGAYTIELFTSEGCSSCPPAERWLSTHVEHSELWDQYFPIAWHVDYWDYLGWKDDFAKSSYSNRQRRYARNDQFNGVYTPGIIVNGQEYRGWRRGKNLTRAVHQLPQDLALNLRVSQQQAALSIQPIINLGTDSDTDLSKDTLRSTLLILGFDVTSKVTRGENRGKRFQHDFVVLDSQSKTLQGLAPGASFTLNTDAIKNRHNAERLAIVAFVETKDSPTPIAITGGWLAD